MLNLFQSNKMSALARAFCARQEHDPDPFKPETVIVQSYGLGQWLKLEVAEYQGISANMDCVLPATFLWRLYQQLVPDSARLSESPFVRERLSWRIMRLIDADPSLSVEMTRYLGKDDALRDLRGYQLAWELAQLFDEYLMYRPDWMLQWAAGDSISGLPGAVAGTATDTAKWQSTLWRALLDDLGSFRNLHRAALHERTLAALTQEPGADLSDLNRISVFGLSTLPPLQLQTFEALAEHRDVDVYFLNPCSQYWGDIVSEKDQARRSLRRLLGKADGDPMEDEDYLDIGNPLLSSLGRQGREFLELMLESPHVISHELFVELPASTALDIVKQDLLELTFGGEFSLNGNPEPLAISDHSIQIHACHSRLREVEVLHDELLRMMAADSSITLTDIIVMVPDIGDYAPYIEAVFRRSLSYRLSDTSSLDDSIMLSSFLRLINLPESRLSGPEVMDLLEVPAIMRRFELTYQDLEKLAAWIDQAGIRWESDGASKAAYWDLPKDSQNTWQFGLNRLLMGLAFDDQHPWEGILPLGISPEDTELLGKLSAFVDQLESCRDQLRLNHSPANWQLLLAELANRFYEPRDQEVLDINQVLNQAMLLSSHASSAAYGDAIGYQLVAHILRQGLNLGDGRAAFISGGITFATLVPMRSIPFKVVCLLGMNDGEYPREVRPHSFDLMAGTPPRKGDRLKSQDDRYLFLEALTSAQDVFYLSYLGKGARDNQDKPPSVVVTEWQSYLSAVFSNVHTQVHALQPFNARYYQGNHLQSYADNWFHAIQGAQTQAFAEAPLPEDTSLLCSSVEQLSQFLRHSGRYFLQQRLGVYLNDENLQLREVETFQLEPLERFKIAEEALAQLVKGDALATFEEQARLSGQLPSGILGHQQLQREIDQAETIFEALQPMLSEPTRLNRTLQLDGRSITVDIDNLCDGQLLSYRVGELRARQLLEMWVRQLAVNACGISAGSIAVHRNRDRKAVVTEVSPLSEDAASYHLGQLLTLYDQGTTQPVFLPPEASRLRAKHREDEDQGRKRMFQNWHADTPGAEGQDRYWQRLLTEDSFGDEFQQLAESVWLPVLGALK